MASHAHRDWRCRGLHHCNRQRETRTRIDNPKRVVKTIFKGDAVCRSKHITGKPRNRGSAIYVYRRPSPLGRIASPNDDEGMRPRRRITTCRSHMDRIGKPIKSIRATLRSRCRNFCQTPRDPRIMYIESIPVPRQDHLERCAVLQRGPQRFNHLGVPLRV